jgi:hypothetical protein
LERWASFRVEPVAALERSKTRASATLDVSIRHAGASAAAASPTLDSTTRSSPDREALEAVGIGPTLAESAEFSERGEPRGGQAARGAWRGI